MGISIHLVKHSDRLVITKSEKSESIEAEKIKIAENDSLSIWPLSFCDKHFDADINDDERTFTPVDIVDAILYGIEVGKKAGQDRTDFIDGLTPRDCAILYADNLQE